MIKIIAYILNLFGAIVNPLGLIGLCGCVAMGDFHILPIAGGVAIVGLIFGTFAYRLDIPHAGIGQNRQTKFSASRWVQCWATLGTLPAGWGLSILSIW